MTCGMSAVRSSFHSVTEYLAWDHDGQEDVIIDARDAVDRGDLAAATTRFDVYEARLLRHMGLEERILFPLVESLAPQVEATVQEMRAEHARIRRSLTAMRQSLAEGDARGFRNSFEALGLVLLKHEAREERVVYPVLDRSLSPEQRVDLADRLAKEH